MKYGLKSLLNIIDSIKNTYMRFFQYYFGETITYNKYWKRQYLNFALICLTMIIYIALIIKNKVYKSKINLIIGFVSLIIMPVCLGFIELIAPEREITLLMASPYILPIIFNIVLLNLFDKKNNIVNITKWINVCIFIMIIGTYILANNANYMAIKMTKNQAYSYAIRLIDRIETNKEYNKKMSFVFAGVINANNYPRNSEIYKMANGSESNFGMFWPSYGGSKATWKQFFENYLGIEIRFCTDKTYKNIIETEEFKNMKNFPDESSVKVINGIMVVKFSDNPPKP